MQILIFILLSLGLSATTLFDRESVGGNSIKLIPTGTEALAERLRLISLAKKSIFISSFIYDIDSSANQISNALCQKALSGVDVRILVDWQGSKKFYKNAAEPLRGCGIGIQTFSPGAWDLSQIVKSLHEKLFIVDGRYFYMGGRGIQNAYHDVRPAHRVFLDLDVSIEGPVACQWHNLFIKHYQKVRKKNAVDNRAYDEHLHGSFDYQACTPVASKENKRIISAYGNPIFNEGNRPIEDVYLKILDELNPGEEVKLYAPYFIPTSRFITALVKAQKRGIKVFILTNSLLTNDGGHANLVAMHYQIDRILKAGITIRLFNGPKSLHIKAGLYGQRFSHVGSDNLDNRGQKWETESVIFTDDSTINSQLNSMFEKDWKNSVPYTKEEIDEVLDDTSPVTHFFSKNFRDFF